MQSNVILINPPWFFAHERDIILSQNLGLGYLAAFLVEHGHKVTIIDALAEGVSNRRKIIEKKKSFLQVGLDYEKIAQKIPRDADFIGISAPFTNNASIVKELAKVIKGYFPTKPILLGGVYPSLTPVHAFCPEIDYYVIGEGEIPLLEIASGVNPEQVQGVLAYGQSNKKIEKAKVIAKLDTIPFPSRNKLPMSQYLSFCSPRKDKPKTASMITSRGCPYDCTFCSIHSITGYKWRMRSAKNVLDEVKLLVEKFGVEHIEFEDDNFTLDKKRAIAIFEGIEKINFEIKPVSWSTPNAVRIDSLDKKLLKIIKKSNCLSLNFAVESGDPALLEQMDKKLNLDTVIYVTELCKQLDIKVNAFFMIGYPGEDHASFKKTLSLIKKLKRLGVENIYSTITRAYPGTKLYDFCEKNNYIYDFNNKDNTYLGNAITFDNAIITPDFNEKILLERLRLIEKAAYPFYLRFYYKYFYQIKKVVPIELIKFIKKMIG